MDLRKFSLEDLFLSAIKAETDSREAYSIMAGITRNAFLRDRLGFLADEEEKHRKLLESEFHRQIPGKGVKLPEVSPVPLPEIKAEEGMPISELLSQAMKAEKAAYEFYTGFARYMRANREFSLTLGYFARMEEGHYDLLSKERDSAEQFEAFDDFNPGMHLGP